MKMKLVNGSTIIIFALSGLMWSSCNQDDSPSMQAPQSTVDKALQLISGTVTKTEMEMEEGVAAWKVDITTARGSEVEIYCRQDNGALLRIDGESPPFDYNVNPGMSLMDFSQAKNIGDGQVSESLEFWRLRAEGKYNNIWVYTLEYTQSKISLDATDGTVLDIEN